jgi:hypothetical protein
MSDKFRIEISSPLVAAACRKLPQRVLKQVKNPPRSGSGVHPWLFRMALQLHHHLHPDQIEQLLATAVKDCGRDVPEREIRDAVANSRNRSRGAQRKNCVTSSQARPKWPPVNNTARSRVITESGITKAALIVGSPVLIDDAAHDANWFIERLFEPGDLLCMGTSASTFATHSRDQFLAAELRESCLIVPSPMSFKHGLTKAGKVSQHTLDNTGPRRYLVTEFDFGTADEQAAIINHLGNFAPLVMVLSSGGKSLHAWWNCVGSGEPEHLRFFRYAVSLGADRATWTPSQFVRLPQGWRADKKARQQVLFFNPAKLPVSEKSEVAP